MTADGSYVNDLLIGKQEYFFAHIYFLRLNFCLCKQCPQAGTQQWASVLFQIISTRLEILAKILSIKY